jgi:pimeloyl-ACP methyl ester carboxylesterase
VLVPGAWHGAWCWTHVAERLRAGGHAVHALTLTGLAERAHLLAPGVDLETHIMDVAEFISWSNLTEVILCGHSDGGMVITGAVERVADRLRGLVYLDAFVPQPGQSCTECALKSSPAEVVASSRSLAVPVPTAAYFGCEGPEAEWIEQRVTPMPAAPLDGRVRYRTDALAGIELTYVLASGWRSNAHFQAAYDYAQRDPRWLAYSVDASHELMVTHPALVAAAIVARVGA